MIMANKDDGLIFLQMWARDELVQVATATGWLRQVRDTFQVVEGDVEEISDEVLQFIFSCGIPTIINLYDQHRVWKYHQLPHSQCVISTAFDSTGKEHGAYWELEIKRFVHCSHNRTRSVQQLLHLIRTHHRHWSSRKTSNVKLLITRHCSKVNSRSAHLTWLSNLWTTPISVDQLISQTQSHGEVGDLDQKSIISKDDVTTQKS